MTKQDMIQKQETTLWYNIRTSPLHCYCYNY